MEGGGVSVPGLCVGAPVSRFANREFEATPSPPELSAILGESVISIDLGEPDILGKRRLESETMVRATRMCVSKAEVAAAAATAGCDKPAEGEKKIETMMVKMDHRNSYIQWLLDWDKKPRRSLRHWPEELRASRDAFEAEDAHHERVLKQYKRYGFAHVQVAILDDDDPAANLPDDQYVEVDEVDLEEEA